ncbi:hypothetical protein J6590_074256 [Homalodisca vitripennis]|nr:hypothetical protein J6590_074256 [Homalodisca vitripennis]
MDNTVRRGGTQVMKRHSAAVHFHTIVGYVPVHRYNTGHRAAPSEQHGTARWYSNHEAAQRRRTFSYNCRICSRTQVIFPYTVKTQVTAPLQVDNAVRRGGTQVMKRHSAAVHFHTIVGYVPVHRYNTGHRAAPSGQHGTARWYSNHEAAQRRRTFSYNCRICSVHRYNTGHRAAPSGQHGTARWYSNHEAAQRRRTFSYNCRICSVHRYNTGHRAAPSEQHGTARWYSIMKRHSAAVHFHTIVGYVPYTGITQDTAPLQVDNTVRRGGTQIMKRHSAAVHFHTIVGYVPVHRYNTGHRAAPSEQHGITQDTAPLQVDNTVRRGGTQIMKRHSAAVHFHTIVGYVPYTGITQDTAPLQVDNTVRRGGTQIMKRHSAAVHFHTIVGYVPYTGITQDTAPLQVDNTVHH